MNYKTFPAKFLIKGEGEGSALVSEESLCFWGGVEPITGEIIDRKHPYFGQSIKGKILVFPKNRGSSSSSAILAETIKCGTNPAAIINLVCEPIIAIGPIVSGKLYKKKIPLVVVTREIFGELNTGNWVVVDGDLGIIKVKG